MLKRFIAVYFVFVFAHTIQGQSFLKMDSTLLEAPLRLIIGSDSIHGPLKKWVLLDSNSLNHVFRKYSTVLSQKNGVDFFSETIPSIYQLEPDQTQKKPLFSDSLKSAVFRLSDKGMFGLKALDFSTLPKSNHIELKDELLSSFLPLSIKQFSQLTESELLQLDKLMTEGLGNESFTKDYHAISKRVVSLKDRDFVDSTRNIVNDKLYRIKESAQDSLEVFLIAEKEELKEKLFFEGLINMAKEGETLSLTDFSGSVGLRLNKYYQIGLGPEIGVLKGDFSYLGARLFAKRKLLQDRLFAVVENSVGRSTLIPSDDFRFEEMLSTWKIGAGTLLDLNPSGSSKLNFQTLVNPQFLKVRSLNLIDFRFGISKLSLKK